jgi:hypothetical protein
LKGIVVGFMSFSKAIGRKTCPNSCGRRANWLLIEVKLKKKEATTLRQVAAQDALVP